MPPPGRHAGSPSPARPALREGPAHSARALRGEAAPFAASTYAAWPFVLLRATEQTLEDLAACGASEVVFVRHPRATQAIEWLDEVDERAREMGFVTAQVRVGTDCAFDALEAVVRSALLAVRPPGAARSSRGVLGLVDAFVSAHARAPLDELEARLATAGLRGDLADLVRGYVAGKGSPADGARVRAWLDGIELARAGKRRPSQGSHDADEPRGTAALSARTAKQVLADLTRLARALGFRGMLLLLRDADAVASFPPARRQAAYTVLRELVDNADGGRGMVSTLLLVAGTTSLFTGPRSMQSLPPLAARVEPPESPAAPPPPHRPVIDLAPPEGWGRAVDARRTPRAVADADTSPARQAAMRDVVRAMHGLPPITATSSASVGQETIDHAIDALFAHSRVDGSVFALITGAYGTGKTHFLLHLAARALSERRPVLRLSLERLDMDLGHPERHLRRLLEHATVPARDDGVERGPLDLLARWTRSLDEQRALLDTLEELGRGEGDAAHAAARALSIAGRAPRAGTALEAHLGAADLYARAPSAGVRRDAYGRLLLWLSLLERLEGCAGPVLLIDEAENLYRGGATKPERRTALRSLSFYCGGALPRAAVALAVTPDALAELREEAPTLLDDVAEQRSVLPWEDASMLCRRLRRARPIPVPPLGREQRAELARRLRDRHAVARGEVLDAGWEGFVAQISGQPLSPREVVRRTAERLERVWWQSRPRP
jgi:hypothetical protein